jgi:hypothetical protein
MDATDAECGASSNACHLCADGEWHCPGANYPPCPSGTAQGASCQGFDKGDCFSCMTGGTATLWICLEDVHKWGPNVPAPAPSCTP